MSDNYVDQGMNTNQTLPKKEILVEFKDLDKKHSLYEGYTSAWNFKYVPVGYNKKHPADQKR